MTASCPFSFTIAEVADEGLIAAKRIGRNPDGSLWKSHYDNATWWRFAPADCASIEAMAARLRSLAAQPRKCILMGAPVAGLDLTRGSSPPLGGPEGRDVARRRPQMARARLRRRDRACRPWPRRSPRRCGALCPRPCGRRPNSAVSA